MSSKHYIMLKEIDMIKNITGFNLLSFYFVGLNVVIPGKATLQDRWFSFSC